MNKDSGSHSPDVFLLSFLMIALAGVHYEQNIMNSVSSYVLLFY